jgi:hypothetical protein
MTWSAIVDQARSLSERFRADGSVAWYRGHQSENWELKSAAHRHVERLTSEFVRRPDAAELRDLLREVSKTLYRRFKAEAWSLLHERERSDWAVLFAMQHFAIPTRLLDWSESFACAVFFAQAGRARGSAAAIWVVDPHAVNKTSVGVEGILSLDDELGPGAKIDPRGWHPRWRATDELRTVAAAPIFSNARMVAQQSAFFLTGDSFEPINAQFREVGDEGRFVKLVLSPDTFDDAEAFLGSAGLNAFSYYPDLEGLARKHEQEVEWTIRHAKKVYPQFFR